MKKILKKVVKAVSQTPDTPKVEIKDTKNLPVAEQSHPEYDPNVPLNKQRHLR